MAMQITAINIISRINIFKYFLSFSFSMVFDSCELISAFRYNFAYSFSGYNIKKALRKGLLVLIQRIVKIELLENNFSNYVSSGS